MRDTGNGRGISLAAMLGVALSTMICLAQGPPPAAPTGGGPGRGGAQTAD